MTICIASSFNWVYGPNDIGKAVITAGDVEYEPPQLKICFLTPRVLILIAGDYTIHSEALMATQRRLFSKPENDPGVIAEMYASFIRAIKHRYAAQTYLSPVGLDQESFLARQSEFAPDFLARLTNQLQGYRSESTEAIIAGADDRMAHIYLVDIESKVSCHDDVGFVAIGIGAWHAKSQMMRFKYSSQWQYAIALALTYTAKKAAEIAPGVGLATDMYIVTRLGWAAVAPELMEKVAELYKDYDGKREKLVMDAIVTLNNFLGELQKKLDAAPAAKQVKQGDGTGEDQSPKDG